MTRHGAPTDPTGAATEAELRGPPRPALVELAAAILIVGGLINLVGAILVAFAATTGTDPFLWLALVLNIASLVVGIFVRTGRAWLIALNYAAVLGFLDLLGSASNPAALMLGIAEIVVVVVLIRHKPWFDAMRDARDARAAAIRA